MKVKETGPFSCLSLAFRSLCSSHVSFLIDLKWDEILAIIINLRTIFQNIRSIIYLENQLGSFIYCKYITNHRMTVLSLTLDICDTTSVGVFFYGQGDDNDETMGVSDGSPADDTDGGMLSRIAND